MTGKATEHTLDTITMVTNLVTMETNMTTTTIIKITDVMQNGTGSSHHCMELAGKTPMDGVTMDTPIRAMYLTLHIWKMSSQ
jgi:hypothetical protein